MMRARATIGTALHRHRRRVLGALLNRQRRAVVALRARRRRTVLVAGTVFGAVLAGTLAGAAVTESWIAWISALLGLAAALAVTLRGLRRSGTENRGLRSRLAQLRVSQGFMAVDVYARSLSVTGTEGPPVEAGGLDLASAWEAQALRRLRNELRRRGYLLRAGEAARACADRGGQVEDQREQAQIEGEIAVLSGQFLPTIPSGRREFEPLPRRVLHVVGNSLPDKQSGYTLRTHYTAVAQRAAGLEPHIVTQMGYGNDGDTYLRTNVDGITYHRIPGPARGSEPMDEWMGRHVQRVASVTRLVRPAVLHAASDFINAQTAVIVGREFGIPVVYESRGFWEETWLSRQAQAFGWDDLDRLEATHGLPDVYRWRREIEDRCRRDADRVVTLAEVMADRVEAGGVLRERVTVIPNAVDVEAFPVLRRNLSLAAELGIDADATVVGYISSVVEYEGIDTLISAYAAVKGSSPTPVALLIVGDGLELKRLRRQAADLGLADAIFTGQVPHDAVLDYYSLIDIFVVPRKPVEVCHVVTPLKPFEAFSTGRTVVMSNVRALAAIAAQSGAAELFEAGDERSLASVLSTLLKDPQRCRELAEAGAAWVRAERTWAANADAYVRLYEEMGAVPAGTGRIARLAADQIDLDELRRSIAAREAIPLEVLADGDACGGADEIMSEGWAPAAEPVAKMDLPIDWTTLWMSNRSWNFRLHSWDFMGPPLRTYATTGERRYLDWCIDRAVSWALVFNEGDARGTMAWYDMALGSRCHRLAYLVEQAVSHGIDAEKLAALLACVVRHQQELFDDRAFNARNNHGVFVALGELALARRLDALPSMDIVADQGRQRLDIVARTQFAADGGHLEHSPEYHDLLLDAFAAAIDARLLDGDEVRRRVALAQDILGWFVQPNGELAQVGDSQAIQSSSRTATSCPTTDFVVTRGQQGIPDNRQLLVLPEAGYAMVRHPQPRGTHDHEDAGYLLMAAGFHSRTHKHADDLSIIWFDQRREILVDAGRYGYIDLLPPDSPLRLKGYYYSAPERQYVESTRAHNTIEVDGTDHLRRGREPYGSAIIDAEERDEHFRIRAEVNHDAWRHHREIVFRPGQWLYVVDSVAAQDDATHDFRAWWNLPEQIVPRHDGQGGLAVDLPDSDGKLWISELSGAGVMTPVTAQRDPLRGWRSKVDGQLTPAWSTGFEVMGVPGHTFQTMFSFGAERPLTPPDHPFDTMP